jgi:hypothetical protein
MSSADRAVKAMQGAGWAKGVKFRIIIREGTSRAFRRTLLVYRRKTDECGRGEQRI